MKARRVLITGATGFVGEHLVQRLVTAGEDVYCLVRDPKRAQQSKVIQTYKPTLIQGDVTDPESLKRALSQPFDDVYHLAGEIRAGGVQQLYEVNREGTRHLAQQLTQQQTPPVLVFVSSIAAAGPSQGEPVHEGSVARPVSEYGHSKLAAEEVLRGFATALPITIVRPSVVFGQNDLKTMLQFFKMGARGILPTPSHYRAHLSLMHVADLCHVLEIICMRGERLGGPETDKAQGLYFATAPEALTYAEIAQHMRVIFDQPVRSLRIPGQLIQMAAFAHETMQRMQQRSTLFGQDKAREVRAGQWYCDGSKAIEDLRLRLRVSLRERLLETAHWYYKHGHISRQPVASLPA